MAKRTSQRRSKRQQKSNNSQMMIYGFAGVILIGVLVLIVSSGGGLNPAPDVSDDRLTLDPVLGNPDAPVTIIEYSAYACHACRSWHQAGIVEEILNEFSGQVNFIQRDFPVISPAYDRMAANTAQCVLDQSQDAFWQFHDLLYTRVDVGASQQDLIETAALIPSIDSNALHTCAEEDTHRATVQFDEDRGRDLGLPGTPAFLVNDQRLFNPSPESLRSAVVAALNS